MAFVIIYDACVLYPAPIRDLLLRIALSGLVRARWSDQILDETFRTSVRPNQVSTLEQSEVLRNPPATIGELLDTLRAQGLVQSVARLREMFSLGSQDPFITS